MNIEEKIDFYLNESSYKKKKLEDDEYYIQEYIPGKSWRIKISERSEFFGLLRKENNKKWTAEIKTADGDLIEYAGIWSKKKDAIEEIIFKLTQIENPSKIMKTIKRKM